MENNYKTFHTFYNVEEARAFVDGKLAAEAQITAAIGDRPKS